MIVEFDKVLIFEWEEKSFLVVEDFILNGFRLFLYGFSICFWCRFCCGIVIDVFIDFLYICGVFFLFEGSGIGVGIGGVVCIILIIWVILE